ncbi:MAG: hypothetical protein ACI4UK_04205, partial [Floccifex sp.]
MNYADGEPYESYRKINTKTAYIFGKVDKVLEYSSKDIPQSYKDEHKEIFAYKRGAGLWLWKPYIILKALNSIKYGDWLFYSDSGVTIIRSLKYLIRCAEKYNQDIFITEQPLLCRQFTKRECYVIMQCEDHDENQALGLLLLLRKSASSVRFIEEWLHYCENIHCLSPDHFKPEIEEWEDFHAHREDQSILSLLRVKWNLPVFRDCSDYGEMPFMYASKDRAYNPKVYSNSDYPTIILCNRKAEPLRYAFMYIIKS